MIVGDFGFVEGAVVDLGEFSRNVAYAGRWQTFCVDLGFIPRYIFT